MKAGKVFIILCMLHIAQKSFAQSRISGTIKNVDSLSVAGANILLMGTPNGTASDYEGHFEMTVPEGKIRLLFALIGYKSLELDIEADKGEQIQVSAILVPDKRKNRKLKSSAKIIQKN